MAVFWSWVVVLDSSAACPKRFPHKNVGNASQEERDEDGEDRRHNQIDLRPVT